MGQVRIKPNSRTAIGRAFAGKVAEVVREINYLGEDCVLVDMPMALPKWAICYHKFPRRLLVGECQVETVGPENQ